MLQKICKFLLLNLFGWRINITVPERKKCILCVAPHTSNWDFIIGELYYLSQGRTAFFLMKKEWFFPPLGYLLRFIGGIPVERNRKTSLTDQLANLALQKDYFNLAITPEGTRAKVDIWKRGFYHIAQKANLPIQLYAIDAKNKRIVCTCEIIPSGNEAQDMQTIFAYYQQFQGLAFHPEQFSVEQT